MRLDHSRRFQRRAQRAVEGARGREVVVVVAGAVMDDGREVEDGGREQPADRRGFVQGSDGQEHLRTVFGDPLPTNPP